MEQKNCRFCHEPLKGRLDKKFCDDYCRSAFNNRIYNTEKQQMRWVNAVLKKNRKILERLYFEKNNDSMPVFEIKIQELGFIFNFHTHVQQMEGGRTCVCCYDYGYIPVRAGEYDVIKVK